MSETPPFFSSAQPTPPSGRLLRRNRRPVTRYRRHIVLGVLLIVGLACVVALAIGFRPVKQPNRTTDPETDADASTASPDFRGLAANYAGPGGGLTGATDPNLIQAGLQRSVDEGGPPQPAPSPPKSLTAEQQQALALAQSARAASPFFNGAATGGSRALSAPVEPVPEPPPTAAAVAPQAKLGEAANGAGQSLQELKRDFIANGSNPADYVSAAYRAPVSPYEIKAGDIISAALVTAVNSDLPGEIVAQVTRNLFDHPTGRHLLVPQGARLLGHYDSQIAYGQSRALIVWNRIIMPDGRSINIGAMTGGDLQGASGLADHVDGHIGPLTRAIALSTAITAGGLLAQDAGSRSNGNLVLSDAAGGVSAQASQAGQRFVERDLNRQPTITIRAGWPLTVIASKDIILEPY